MYIPGTLKGQAAGSPLATAADGTITYYWQRFFCADGTLWN